MDNNKMPMGNLPQGAQNAPQAPQNAPQMAQPQVNPLQVQIAAQQEKQALQEFGQRKIEEAFAPKKIGSEQIMKASEILRKYKAGKSRLEQKIIANEQFWKLRQWNYMPDGKNDFKPASAWLWACIQSRYSDAMDSYPTCNIQPRQKDDRAEALKLSQIVPVILEQNRYEDVYSDIVWYTLKQGGCVQAIYWDGTKHNGLGDIAIKKIDLLNIFWEPGITDLQQSRNIFTVELVDNDLLIQRYPQCEGKLGRSGISLNKYVYDDYVDTQDKSLVVDWYYHTEYNGKKVLHYCKYVDDVVLYATENETERPVQKMRDQFTGIPVMQETGSSMAETGLYEHGLYPFVSMALYPIEGSICGMGLTDLGRDTQFTIDKLNKAIIDNAATGAKPRYFVRGDGTVNLDEYADTSNDFIQVAGNIGEENIRPIDHKSLDSIYVNVLQNKIEELKYITSNQDQNNGMTSNGVTSGTAIAALQESAGKNARSSAKVFHAAFRDVCYQVVELIRQFYDMPRTFRIVPDSMGEQFIDYDNTGLKGQEMSTAGIDMGLRLPEFDIDVTSEKSSPYKKMEINELALNFYNAGFFNPQMADQALSCVEMMDFNKKYDVIAKIRANGTMYESLIRYQQLALQLAQQVSPQLAEQVGQMILQDTTGADPNAMGLAAPGIDMGEGNEEASHMQAARQQARESTQA